MRFVAVVGYVGFTLVFKVMMAMAPFFPVSSYCRRNTHTEPSSSVVYNSSLTDSIGTTTVCDLPSSALPMNSSSTRSPYLSVHLWLSKVV